MLFSISKHFFQKSEVVTQKDKAKSKPIARLKVRIFSKSAVKTFFLVFPSVIQRRRSTLQRATSVKAWKLNEQG